MGFDHKKAASRHPTWGHRWRKCYLPVLLQFICIFAGLNPASQTTCSPPMATANLAKSNFAPHEAELAGETLPAGGYHRPDSRPKLQRKNEKQFLGHDYLL